jgi:hypothetical protein
MKKTSIFKILPREAFGGIAIEYWPLCIEAMSSV